MESECSEHDRGHRMERDDENEECLHAQSIRRSSTLIGRKQLCVTERNMLKRAFYIFASELPPSTTKMAPVIQLAAGLARYTAI